MGKQSTAKGIWRSTHEWRSLHTEFEQSGLSVKAFCRQQSISASNFYRWRNLLASNEPVGQAPATAFLDIGALTPPTKTPARLELTLDLGDGLILRLSRS